MAMSGADVPHAARRQAGPEPLKVRGRGARVIRKATFGRSETMASRVRDGVAKKEDAAKEVDRRPRSVPSHRIRAHGIGANYERRVLRECSHVELRVAGKCAASDPIRDSGNQRAMGRVPDEA